MDYSDFLPTWNKALNTAGLNFPGLFPEQSVDLRSIDRTYRTFIPFGLSGHRFSPFHVTVELSWRWDALLSARFDTSEEDLLMQIYGEHGVHEDTDQPWLRVDFAFHAGLQKDLYALFPSPEAWRKWAAAVTSQIPPSFAEEFDEDEYDWAFSWCGEPVIETICSSSGQFYLSSVSLPAWKGIALPRQWDDPERLPEEDPFDPLVELFTWIRKNAQLWGESLKALY
ncbi:MAG: hypothetical protein WC832_08905 [Anaerolineales bacterium]